MIEPSQSKQDRNSSNVAVQLIAHYKEIYDVYFNICIGGEQPARKLQCTKYTAKGVENDK